MSNQTVQRPPKRRSTTTNSAAGKARGKVAAPAVKSPAKVSGSAAKYRARQTARVEGLRDGKPLIFGWGRHLTRAQKARYQRISVAAFAGLVIVAVLGTIVYGVLNENVFIPNSAVVTVNGVKISQDTYRKNLAVEAQNLWNLLQNEISQDAVLQTKAQKGDQTAALEDNIIQSQIQSNEGKYGQSVITQTSITDLINDVIIQRGAKQIEQEKHVSASTFEPSQKEIDAALAAFKKAFPKNETYADFLKSNSMSDGDVRAALAVQLRQTKMQKYLASALVTPTRQVHIRKIQTDKRATADSIRAALVKAGLTDAIWSTLAKQDSLDTTSKATGGDQGYVAPGTGDVAIEAWAYASDRKAGDLSPVIADASGTFDIVQLLEVDTAHVVDAATLKSAQDNALSHWLSMQTYLLGSKVGSPNATALSATRNLPKTPSLTAPLPTITPPAGSGLPGSSGVGGLPSGLPSGSGG